MLMLLEGEEASSVLGRAVFRQQILPCTGPFSTGYFNVFEHFPIVI